MRPPPPAPGATARYLDRRAVLGVLASALVRVCVCVCANLRGRGGKRLSACCLIHSLSTQTPPPPSHAQAVAPRPARAAEPAGATGTAPTVPPPDEPPIITQLRARSAANKAANDAARLQSYYARNADALRVLLDRGGARTLDPEIRAKIQAWLDANGV